MYRIEAKLVGGDTRPVAAAKTLKALQTLADPVLLAYRDQLVETVTYRYTHNTADIIVKRTRYRWN